MIKTTDICSKNSILLFLGGASLFCSPLHANDNITLSTFAVSQQSHRGLAETPNGPAVGLNAEWSKDKVHIGSTAQSSRSVPVQQREQSFLVYAGWQHTIKDDLAIGFDISHRIFPGSTKEWDYSELNIGLAWSDKYRLELAYSPDYYEHDTTAFIVSANALREINPSIYVNIDGGSLSFSRNGFDSYQYLKLGFGYRKQRFVTELSYTHTSNEDAILFGTLARPTGLNLELSYLLK